MAMLASKTPFPAPLLSTSNMSSSAQSSAMQSSRRAPATMTLNQSFASPTESEFSDVEGPESAKNWSEERVCDWLRTINCGEYEKLFKKNNINGENLLEMDKAVLQEMGIEKIGDRVRLFLGIKKLRTKAYANQKKRNRDSFAGLDAYTPSSSSSPRPPNSGNSRAMPTPPANKRYSRQFENFNPATAIPENVTKPPSRPNSPLTGNEVRAVRQQRYGVMSPAEITRRENAQGYFNGPGPMNPGSAATSSGRRPTTPGDGSLPTARPINVHTRGNGSVDSTLTAQLPPDQGLIRVISSGDRTKVFRVADCTSVDDVMRLTLRKHEFREDRIRSYCFYVLAGLEADPRQCRRLSETELWRIIKDPKRAERNRLMLRKIHEGVPGDAELKRAAAIAMEEVTINHDRALESADNKRSRPKVEQVLGESWNNGLQHPLSPASFQSANSAVSPSEREAQIWNTSKDLERPPSLEQPRDTARHRPTGK